MMKSQIESFYTELGRRLYQARIRCGFTQEELGSKLSPPLTRASIANIENAKQRVLAHTLVELATVLDVALSALVPASNTRVESRETTDQLHRQLQQELQLQPEQLAVLTDALGLGRQSGAKP